MTRLAFPAVLLLLPPSACFLHPGTKQNTLAGAAVAMSPASDALAAAAIVRRNVLSGAAIFTVGDIAAQLVTVSQKARHRERKRKERLERSLSAGTPSCSSTPLSSTTTLTPPKPSEPNEPTAARTATRDAAETDRSEPDPEELQFSDSEASDAEEAGAEPIDVAKAVAIAIAIPIADETDTHRHRAGFGKEDSLAARAAKFRRFWKQPIDTNRLWSAAVLGAVWSGLCVPFIYGSVERRFPGRATLRQLLTKVLVTCGILSTIGNYATMYARRFLARCTTHQFDEACSLRFRWASRPVGSLLLLWAIAKGCAESCNRDILEVVVDDIKIWPLYDLTCYGLIPPSWRPITTSVMSSGWAMYMSVVSANESRSDDDDEEEEREDAPERNPAARKASIRRAPLSPPGAASPDPVRPAGVLPASLGAAKRLIAVAGGTSCSPADADKTTTKTKTKTTTTTATTKPRTTAKGSDGDARDGETKPSVGP